MVKKNFKDMYNSRLDRIPACDRQTDRQPSCHGTVRAMHTRRAVKTEADRAETITRYKQLPTADGTQMSTASNR